MKSSILKRTPETFSPREERLAALLAAGWTVRGAAGEIAVSERQCFTWKAKRGFPALVDKIRSEMFASALGRLAALTSKAADTLEELLDKDKPTNVRLGAARGILADAATLRTSVEIERRIAELEERVDAKAR